MIKKLTILLCLLFASFLSSSPAFAADKGIPIYIYLHSFADRSCGAWARSSSDPPVKRAEYYFWFIGFISGYNFGNPSRQIPLELSPDADSLYLFVDKYCKEHPLEPFDAAAFKLIEELLTKASKENLRQQPE